MQPPPPPAPPPPANTFAAQVGRVATGFMNTAVGAAANVIGGGVGNAVLQGVGNIVGQGAGLAEGILGVGVAAPMAAAAAIGAASMAPAFMPADVPMASFREQRPNDRRNRDTPMRQAAHNAIQGLHNQGRGPAAFVDTRTLNGQNFLKPKDKRVRIRGKQKDDDWQGYTGAIGGGSSSSSAGLPPAGFTIPMPSAPPAEPDLPPSAPPSFNDLMGKIKAAPMIGVGTRERSPRRADNPVRPAGWTRLDPETPGRANALAIRSNVVSLRTRRKAGPARDPNPAPTKRKPEPRGGTKRKAEDDINPLVRRPPPKPTGRLNAKKKPTPVIAITAPPPPPPPPPPDRAGKKMAKKDPKSKK